MTNLEVLKFLIGTSGSIDDNRLNAALFFNGIDPEGIYTTNDNKLKCNLYQIAIGEIKKDISSGVASVSQGDYSISFNAKAANNKIKWLANESGCKGLIEDASDEPVIRNRTNFW